MSDESVRWRIMGPGRGTGHTGLPAVDPRRMTALTRAEALAFLGSVSHGRIVYLHRAVPCVRPAIHLLERGELIIRPHQGAADTAHPDLPGEFDGAVVYEADALDPATHLGWSVIVTGCARRVTDSSRLGRYRVTLQPWVGTADDQVVCLHFDQVTGVWLTATPQVVAGP